VTTDRRLPQALSVHQAAGNSPTLARLTELIADSNARFKAIKPLLPEALLSAVKPGPIEGESWCLLVSSNAAAAKIRQLLPLLQANLLERGWKATSIQLKILIAKK
jgi:hypothetical protein